MSLSEMPRRSQSNTLPQQPEFLKMLDRIRNRICWQDLKLCSTLTHQTSQCGWCGLRLRISSPTQDRRTLLQPCGPNCGKKYLLGQRMSRSGLLSTTPRRAWQTGQKRCYNQSMKCCAIGPNSLQTQTPRVLKAIKLKTKLRKDKTTSPTG